MSYCSCGKSSDNFATKNAWYVHKSKCNRGMLSSRKVSSYRQESSVTPKNTSMDLDDLFRKYQSKEISYNEGVSIAGQPFCDLVFHRERQRQSEPAPQYSSETEVTSQEDDRFAGMTELDRWAAQEAERLRAGRDNSSQRTYEDEARSHRPTVSYEPVEEVSEEEEEKTVKINYSGSTFNSLNPEGKPLGQILKSFVPKSTSKEEPNYETQSYDYTSEEDNASQEAKPSLLSSVVSRAKEIFETVSKPKEEEKRKTNFDLVHDLVQATGFRGKRGRTDDREFVGVDTEAIEKELEDEFS
jgi:hypothetical protein